MSLSMAGSPSIFSFMEEELEHVFWKKYQATRSLRFIDVVPGASSASAHAADHYFTASIDSKGAVIRQSPEWIRSVKHYPRPGIFLNMKYPSRLAYLSEHQGSALYL
jgi:hypothetical protein